jgi:hypothetical protein
MKRTAVAIHADLPGDSAQAVTPPSPFNAAGARPPRTQRKVNDREHSHGPLGVWPGIPEVNSAKESDLSLRTRARALIQ